MYLFDTDVASNPLKPRPSSVLLARLQRVSPADQFICAVTVGELFYGAQRSNRPQYHLERISNEVLQELRVLPFDQTAAVKYGEIRAQLELAGTPLAISDLQIASIALAHNLTVVTGNIRHFARIPGLRVENWLVE